MSARNFVHPVMNALHCLDCPLLLFTGQQNPESGIDPNGREDDIVVQQLRLPCLQSRGYIVSQSAASLLHIENQLAPGFEELSGGEILCLKSESHLVGGFE